jgi:NADH-quinone oxidoreductase subunit N
MIEKNLQNILASSQLILPELMLAIGILSLVVIISFAKSGKSGNFVFFYSLSLIFAYSFFAIRQYQNVLSVHPFLTGFGGMVYIDKASLFFKQLIGLSAFVFIVHARLFKYKFANEVYFLVLCVILGLVFLTMTTHFFVIFVGLELVSLSSYALVAFQKNKINFEAAIKYLIFGATTTAIMLMGVSLFYGITHSFNFSSADYIKSLGSNSPAVIQSLSFLFMGGLLFKTAAAPFHSWVADVYEATPTPLVSFLSFAPKAAGFLLLARFVHFAPVSMEYAVVTVAVLSLVVGNLSALSQTNAKRMLAYSGIAQSGFILMGLLKGDTNDFYGTFFYILAYLPITMGSFFLVDVLFKLTNSLEMKDYAGIGQKNVFLGLNSLVIMVALIGLPPTVGFLAKLMVFSSIATGGEGQPQTLYFALVVFGLLNAAISIYYYLKIPYFMLVKSAREKTSVGTDYFLTFLLSYFSFAIIFLFFFPDRLSEAINAILFR